MTERRGGDVRIRIGIGDLDMSDVAVGDSVCVSGVCLTVIDSGSAPSFYADVSTETLSCTTLGALRATMASISKSRCACRIVLAAISSPVTSMPLDASSP